MKIISIFKFIPGIVCPFICFQAYNTESGNQSLKGRKTLRKQISNQMTFVVVKSRQSRLEPDVRKLILMERFCFLRILRISLAQALRPSVQVIGLDLGPLAGKEDIENRLRQTFEASNSKLYTGVLLISKMTFRTNL